MSRDHHLPPFTDYKQLSEKGARIITKAEGVYIWDSEGNKILDAMAGLWCVASATAARSWSRPPPGRCASCRSTTSTTGTAHPPVVELAKAIADVAPEGMNRMFFTGSGSEANDTVLRMVRHYWATKGQPQKKVVIGRWNGYNSTVAGVSLGGMKALHEQGDFPIPGIVIAQPYWYGEGGDGSPDEFGVWAAEQLEKKILEVGEESIRRLHRRADPGRGGVIVPPDTYWPKIREILAKYDILFIADEVVSAASAVPASGSAASTTATPRT
ncbi:aminotransferase class III-fold pyridoxal phosphate-dependent enzyme [Pseudomonas aeruginosa]|uniref:aminotransferase class III-fold pyridoxal phosphate-dependent enzyme n=1 Tax=Pseudomonas aeruginosa TaxID=287 RepID=UPI00249B5159|nr:aminotransferase class III-fold pyridoxal phosphate-dependent enzyme [Pseudomonas aeruginosa]WGW99238.1 aminotransferase class III-fold pyridoxal phosphate-dependent enzyme [Pseudomonas aeruginosa]